ncbi:hypothetical protein [Streptococcus gordonii]|uniref:hypothetical protein n=1 Tax=Streptococcus gordonii TaxID=1302 RepID=UPI00077986E9|nr:hypothetical protein [Streptococcus gordonii]MBW7664441.1 hypothetical protein [Streptococcus gordonii]
MINKESIAIYSRKGIGLIIIFSLMIIISFFKLFSDENMLTNFLYFIGSVGLLLTVGWMAFAFMGKIQFDGKHLLVRRNFKCYRFILSSVRLYFGKKKYVLGGSYEYPLFIVGEVYSENNSNQRITLKLVGSKRKNLQLNEFYQNVLLGKVQALPNEDTWRINELHQLEIISDMVDTDKSI